MTKKSFKSGFDVLLGDSVSPKSFKNKERAVRTTFIIKEGQLEKLKALSFWEKKTIKDILEEALNKHLEEYEKNKGPIQLPK